MGRSRYKIIEGEKAPYFITCTVVNWIPVFGIPPATQIVIDSLAHLIDKKRISLHGYVIMENHVHLILSSGDIRRELRRFKSYTARKIIDFLVENKFETILHQLSKFKKKHKISQDYQFWQEDYHPERIVSYSMLNQKLEYIHFNPVRRGYVDHPGHWKNSSYRNYFDGEGVLPIEVISL